MNGPVTVEDFLVMEEESRRLARLRAPAREVRRFHAAVRRFATAWCTRPSRRIAAVESAKGTGLNFEVEDRYGWVPIFCLRAVHPSGEFCLQGPGGGGKLPRMTGKLRKAVTQLAKTWRDLPGGEPADSKGLFTIHLPKLADSGFDRYLETALQSIEEH